MKKLLSMVTILALSSVGAMAAGTAANTTVTNKATLSFSVEGVTQTPVTSNEDSFVVDKKIDFVLANNDGDQIHVVPGATDQITTWSIVNEGNMDQNFTFTASQLTNSENIYGDADTKDSEALILEYDNDGTWATLTTLEISVDDNISIRIRTDIDATRVDGDVMNISLSSVAVDATGTNEQATSGADNKDAMDTVLAEGVGAGSDAKENGTFVAWGGYIVIAPNLDLTKSSCVLTDPVNLTTDPKRIPGSTVLYILDINNTSATTDATDVNISDVLESSLDISTLANLKSDDGQDSCSCSDGTAYSGGAIATNAGTGQEVKVTGLTITQGKHNCISFEVEID